MKRPHLPPAPLDRPLKIQVLLAAAVCVTPLLLQLPGALAAGLAGVGATVAIVGLRSTLPRPLRAALALAAIGLVLGVYDFRFGRDTGCALLAAMLVIKPMELFGVRDARSLLGFSLFAPFSTFLLDQGPTPLLLGTGGAILVMMAMLALSEHESNPGQPMARPWPRFRAIARLVVVGLPLALTAFWLFPRLESPLWGLPERAIGTPGLSDEMTPGEWLDLMGDDTPALRVTFFGATPQPEQRYWRGPVLSEYDGRSWRRSDRHDGQSPTRIGYSQTRWDYQVEMEPTERHYLVALDLPATQPQGARLNRSGSLYSERPLTGVTRWRLQSAAPSSFEPELSASASAHHLWLPEDFNPRSVALARQWRAEAGPGDDVAIVDRAMAWINREFAYTLSTPYPGRHAVDEFLFDYQAGFCEHFSSAFAVLMRAAGIPSRVVTGYAGGDYNRLGGYWIVRRDDAHAWTEVWLEGRGWVRVDPTAAVAPERIYDTIDDLSTVGADGTPLGGSRVYVADWLRRGWNDFALGFNATRQQTMLSPFGIERLDVSRLIGMFALAALLALGWMLWLITRAEREHDPVLRAWHRLGRRYARFGLARAPHEPALAWCERVLDLRPQDHELLALSRRFAYWRYAQDPGGEAYARMLIRELSAWRPVRHAAQETRE